MTAAPLRVLVAGGGVAAVETVLALRALAGPAVTVGVVAPDERFAVRALAVAEPFAAGHADAGAFPELVAELGADLHRAKLVSVDPETRTVACSDGETLSYDALVLAPGPRMRPAFAHGISFGLGDRLALNGLLADLEHGHADAVAFVVPSAVSWSLPLYELALLTARQVRGMGRDVTLHLVTPEPGALAVFGPEAAAATRELLEQAGIALHSGTPVAVGRGRVHLLAGGGADLEVDRVVSLPVLEGPALEGVPADAGGFIPVDAFSRVAGLDAVYAAGDATDLLVKQGGLACQQADVAAAGIARAAGADVTVTPLAPVLRGRLLTGGGDHFLRRDLGEAHGSADVEPLWWPPMKVAGRHLGPWLAGHGLADRRPVPEGRAAPEPPAGAGVEVELPLGPWARRAPDVLGLEPLGRMRA